MQMNCINKHCRKDIPEGAKFCPWCGKPQARKRPRRANGEGCGCQLPNGKWKTGVPVQYRLDDTKPVRDRSLQGIILSTKKLPFSCIPENGNFLFSTHFERQKAGNLSISGSFWRRKRDLNPRDTFAPYSLSRGAPSPLGYFSVSTNEYLLFPPNKFGGEGGIRTHAPFRTNGFQDRLVMTTSIPLRIEFSRVKQEIL